MLLAIDIGNTKIKFGLFENDHLIKSFSLDSKIDFTFDTLAKDLTAKPHFVAISSVVPQLTDKLSKILVNAFEITPLLVDHSSDLGINVKYDPPTAVGIDRLIAASAAAQTYGFPCVVCSLGTATTIDAVNVSKDYLGGIIAPGLTMMATSLHQNTAKLPFVDIYKPSQILGTSTETSIRSGVFYGYLGLVNELITRIKKEVGESAKVIVTGGNGELVSSESSLIDHFDRHLILEGINLITRRQS